MKFKKDLLISIASLHVEDDRGRLSGPERLDKTIMMIYDTCESKDNFDIQVIINEHQYPMYEPILKKWDIKPTIIIFYPDSSWEQLIKAQNDLMKQGQYYFFSFFPDDMYGLSKDWDKNITDKKHFFKDDLFVLYSNYVEWGRDQNKFLKCYDNPDEAFKIFEQSPVWTYKFGEFMYKLFEEPYKYNKGREILLAIILHLLNEVGHNRHINGEWKYESMDCDVNKSDSNFPQIQNLIKQDCNDLRQIIKDMEDYINEFKS